MAYHHFNVKNIAQHSEEVDEEYASTIFCDDFQQVFGKEEPCNPKFIQERKTTYKRIYGLVDQDFDADPLVYQDNVFLFVHVTESGHISNMPLNLTVHLHHNTTMLDNLMKLDPDEVSQRFGNVK